MIDEGDDDDMKMVMMKREEGGCRISTFSSSHRFLHDLYLRQILRTNSRIGVDSSVFVGRLLHASIL